MLSRLQSCDKVRKNTVLKKLNLLKSTKFVQVNMTNLLLFYYLLNFYSFLRPFADTVRYPFGIRKLKKRAFIVAISKKTVNFKGKKIQTQNFNFENSNK